MRTRDGGGATPVEGPASSVVVAEVGSTPDVVVVPRAWLTLRGRDDVYEVPAVALAALPPLPERSYLEGVAEGLSVARRASRRHRRIPSLSEWVSG
jgi:hypothetical protein